MSEAGKIKSTASARASLRIGSPKTKSIRDINAQTGRISQLARQTGSYGSFENALNIAANYRANIRNTPEYQSGEWRNGVYSGADMQFSRSVYARTRKNNR